MSPGSVTIDKPAARRLWTYEEMVAELLETNLPCELWDGELVLSPTPTPFHQQIVLRFYEKLVAFVRDRQSGVVLTAPLDIVLSPHRVVQPDVMFLAKENREVIQKAIMGPVDLAVEVISLGGRQRDRIDKKDLYEQYGIKEYWIIDPESKTVDVLSLEAAKYVLVMRGGPGETVESRLLSGFTVSVDNLFANPIGEL